VIDLLGGVREYVYPVGRLDFASDGLLLLTNDGDLAARLTHPRHGVPRVYEALVRGVPDAHDLKRLAKGVTIDGRPTQPAIVKVLRLRDGSAVLEITVREGRNRQVRKMCEAIGHPVSQLTRVAIGPLRDSRLKAGQWRDLGDAEVLRLRAAAARTAVREEDPGGHRAVATSPRKARGIPTPSSKLKGQRQK
jgi:23S rRNA pseudouridine2605 synthase